ncbi:thiamine pyrophosphate-binding protein [Granulosicoccus sp. 3-233]|uniref:thiamine pyrophosphate-binding protein n=1 Tax=Granulosicoccus sp. 3-233 TaxID=3417969 RepID=UPI003D352FE1
MTRQTGGQLLVNALKNHGVERVFCVPGESYLPVLDALYDSGIENTLCRQEGGAAMMAEAWGKLTATPGICFVTRGPGATNATAGLHVALQDSTPMILFIGQIDTGIREREAFQEVNYHRFLGESVKWVAEIEDAERMDEMISRAFHVATSGRPGPVALALPENALSQLASSKPVAPWQQIETCPGEEQMAQLTDLLKDALRPMVILGGSRWNQDAVLGFQRLAQQWQLPVACSFRRQMLFDHTHGNYAGDVGIGINPALRQRIEEADLLLMIGARLSEMPSQDYTLLDIPSPQQTLVHVHPGAEELGRVYRPTLAIHASPTAFVASFESRSIPAGVADRSARVESAHQDYLSWSTPDDIVTPGDVQMGKVMQSLLASLPEDAIITNGAGNYASWIHRFWKFRHYGSQLAPTSGSMGYGLPAAIAAKLCEPERTVVAFAGDGCFQMTMQEFGTAVQSGANIIVLLIDNGIYGTIRMHQERHFPGRVSATSLQNPDFAALARAYGAFSCTVRNDAEFLPALQQAMDAETPSLIHVCISAEAITPTMTLSQIRQQAEKAAASTDTAAARGR